MRRKILDVIDGWYRSKYRSALMIRGARQVGKTYAVEMYCDLNRIHHLKIDLSKDSRSREVFDGDLTVDAIILGLSAIHTGFEFIHDRTLIFLDEIQECPNARTALKSFATDKRYRVIASGSLLGLKMRSVRLPPTGYVESVDMRPMDFEEFLWALGVPQAAIDAVRTSISACTPIDGSLFDTFSGYYRWYIAVGGMPDAVRSFVESKQFGPVRNAQSMIVEGYKDDIRKHIDDMKLRAEVESCFDAVPRMLAAENKRFVFNDIDGKGEGSGKGYYDGYDRYAPALEWLSMADVTLTCRRVSEMHMPLKERTRGNMFKLYMLDTGILMDLYEPELVGEVVMGDVGVNYGAIAENAIAQALVAQGRELYFYQDPKGRTGFDFVMPTNGKICAVRVVPGKGRSCPSLNRAVGDLGLEGIMFETRNCFEDDKGIRHYPLFAASFLDSIDRYGMPVFDPSGIDRLKAGYGSPEDARTR